MAMTLVYSRVSAEKIVIAFTINIPNKDTFALFEYNR
jgi:hypothetical protein